MRRATTPLVVALFLTACGEEPIGLPVVPDLSVVSSVVVSARGAGLRIQNGELRGFSFSAVKTADGVVRGEYELQARQADVNLHGDVICLVVLGNVAYFGATIERGFDAEGAIFAAQDNGQGADAPPDQISFLQPRSLDVVQEFCQRPFIPGGFLTVERGNIQVSRRSLRSEITYSIEGVFDRSTAPSLPAGTSYSATLTFDPVLFVASPAPLGGTRYQPAIFSFRAPGVYLIGGATIDIDSARDRIRIDQDAGGLQGSFSAGFRMNLLRAGLSSDDFPDPFPTLSQLTGAQMVINNANGTHTASITLFEPVSRREPFGGRGRARSDRGESGGRGSTH